jgi:type II secretory ATPase GspE/PulE/Tfp pilus assembly ATPase PilB-like protein
MPSKAAPKVETLQKEVKYRKKLGEITNLFNSAPSLNFILVNLKDKILDLIGAERVTIFAIDSKNQELYSLQKSGDDIQEIRVPKTFASMAGFTALSRQSVRVKDAYDASELTKIHQRLKFDSRWDTQSGFKTTQVLALPIMFEKYLIGVLELINKNDGLEFTGEDQESAEEIARMLGVAFYNQNRASKGNKQAGGKWSHLLDKGAISAKDLEAAASSARVNNTDVARVLMEKHKIPKEEIGASLAQFYHTSFFTYTGSELIPDEFKKRIPFDFLKKNLIAPVERKGSSLVVAIEDPLDLVRLDGFKALGLSPNIEVQVALKADLLTYIFKSYGQSMDSADAGLGRILVELGEESDEVAQEEETDDDIDETDSTIVRLSSQIIVDGYNKGASDIHVEPNGAEAACMIRFRIDGTLIKYMELPAPHRSALVQRFKIMATLDIAEKRKPQDGKIRFKTPQGIIELRVATIPTSGGNEDVVMRILAASKPHPIDKMGMSERNLKEFKAIVQKPYGMILCVGPTGSGKTTTLHSGLGYINKIERKIWTAEDPVEITQPGLRQVQVHPKIGFTFAAAMRSFLRADPDVIMVGEMRDTETASTGIEASLTGHLVFSTLHTNSAPETITRLLDMDIDPFSFADSLLGVLAQRLGRTLCGTCKEEYEPSQAEFDELKDSYGPELFDQRVKIKSPKEVKLSRPKGCATCMDSGYKGRIALHELLIGSDEIKRLIVAKSPVEQIRQMAVEQGMSTLLQDGIQKVIQGKLDYKQVRAVCIK